MSQYLSAFAILLMVMSPVLIPAIVTVVHRASVVTSGPSPTGVGPSRPRRLRTARHAEFHKKVRLFGGASSFLGSIWLPVHGDDDGAVEAVL